MKIYIGNNIKILRKKRSINQEAIALQLNTSYQTISNWERQKSYPSLEETVKISNILCVSVDDLLKTDLSKEEEKHKKENQNEDWEEKYRIVEKLYMELKIEFEKSKKRTA